MGRRRWSSAAEVGEKPGGARRLAKEEEHALRCLGAAVIMQWNDLPTKIQRDLFDHAISMGEPRYTAQLKERIARFLHRHKNDEFGKIPTPPVVKART